MEEWSENEKQGIYLRIVMEPMLEKRSSHPTLTPTEGVQSQDMLYSLSRHILYS